jgi:hypothetical protein
LGRFHLRLSSLWMQQIQYLSFFKHFSFICSKLNPFRCFFTFVLGDQRFQPSSIRQLSWVSQVQESWDPHQFLKVIANIASHSRRPFSIYFLFFIVLKYFNPLSHPLSLSSSSYLQCNIVSVLCLSNLLRYCFFIFNFSWFSDFDFEGTTANYYCSFFFFLVCFNQIFFDFFKEIRSSFSDLILILSNLLMQLQISTIFVCCCSAIFQI